MLNLLAYFQGGFIAHDTFSTIPVNIIVPVICARKTENFSLRVITPFDQIGGSNPKPMPNECLFVPIASQGVQDNVVRINPIHVRLPHRNVFIVHRDEFMIVRDSRFDETRHEDSIENCLSQSVLEVDTLDKRVRGQLKNVSVLTVGNKSVLIATFG